MIPKIIHYIWLGGGAKSERIKTCYESWKKNEPDWRDFITNERTSVCVQSNILAAEGINRDDDSMQYCKDFVVYPSSCFHTKGEGYAYHSWEGSW